MLCFYYSPAKMQLNEPIPEPFELTFSLTHFSEFVQKLMTPEHLDTFDVPVWPQSGYNLPQVVFYH